MQDISQWTTHILRTDESRPTWLEERKFEWIPLVTNTLQRVFSGDNLVLVTDRDREWFGDYVVNMINKSVNRPYIPIINIHSLFPQVDKNCKNELGIELVADFLGNVFNNKYLFWYIGRNDDRAKLALSNDFGFLWLFDTDLQNSFTLQSTDTLVDIKLMQMFRIFNLTIEAALFGQISLD